ncbi:MAG TPA: hypothetical protein VM012_00640 [Flavitalea sp.]|nr:hypothetical protein [Flavitalea sp.]
MINLKNVYWILILIAAVLIPYIAGLTWIFRFPFFVPLLSPDGILKTVMILVFFALVVAMIPVLPLLLLNFIPPAIAFLFIQIFHTGRKEGPFILIGYHVLFLITAFYTARAGREIFRAKLNQ